jgi:hypothetical protein
VTFTFNRGDTYTTTVVSQELPIFEDVGELKSMDAHEEIVYDAIDQCERDNGFRITRYVNATIELTDTIDQ